MRKCLWFASIVLSSALAGAAVLHAATQPGGHTPPFGAHGDRDHCPLAHAVHAHLRELHAELNLTDAQVSAVHAALQSRRTELAAAFRPAVQAHRAVISALHADTVDETAIRTASDALGRSVGDAAIAVARVKGEVLRAAALTPEQTTKLAAIRTRIDGALGRLVESLQPPAENPR